MARPWTVSPHGPIEKLEDNLWVVQGTVPTPGGIKRRMAIVRRGDGSLWFFHAIPLEEPLMAEVTAWGRPEALIVAHDQHCIDAHAFAERLRLRIYGPAKNLETIRARPLDAAPLSALPTDPDVTFEEMDGTKAGEAVAIVRSGDRVSVLFADCLQNTPKHEMAFYTRWLGFGGGPKVVPLFRWMFTTDRARLRAHLERLATLPGLARIIPFHGHIIDTDAAATLRSVAATL